MKDFIIPGQAGAWGNGIQDETDRGTPAATGAPVTLTIDGMEITVPAAHR
ncbi:MAG: hypothetical protein KJ731_14170 [Alphaproteobacteria bacterium]|nr:hypothetical protein [Alphaproteobacteria bacterium]MBU1829599.1 hypothetical protein [Alphaproteobacteria bacterium]